MSRPGTSHPAVAPASRVSGTSHAALAPASRAAAQVGVWTRRDAVRMYGESRVRAQLLARRWTTPLPHVLVTHNGPLTKQRLWVALLGAPPGALLHGLSAAARDGLRGLAPDGLTLVIPLARPASRRRPSSISPPTGASRSGGRECWASKTSVHSPCRRVPECREASSTRPARRFRPFARASSSWPLFNRDWSPRWRCGTR
jgi:hypothetical protein